MIKVTSNFKEIAFEFKAEGKKIDMATITALNKVANQGRTLASKKVREQYTIKAGAAKKAISVSEARENKRVAVIKAKGKKLSLGQFAVKQSSIGAVIQVRRGHKKVLKGMFITQVTSAGGTKHKGVFFRKGPKVKPAKGKYAGTNIMRQQIFERYTLSMAEMFRARRVIEDVKTFVAVKFPEILEQRIEFYNK